MNNRYTVNLMITCNVNNTYIYTPKYNILVFEYLKITSNCIGIAKLDIKDNYLNIINA